jgi:hypothetical protein|nr:hypothetical protein [Kofleriaceae bacterium]
MRLAWLALVLAACGGSSGNHNGPDGGSGSGGGDGSNAPPPRIIPGGGIGDGPIDGVAYVYAIDDATRQPIPGAAVSVGTVTGTTDATGLFTATGVTGAQDVVVTAAAHRSEVWLGANGTNLTIDLQTQTAATPPSANLAGTIDLSSFTAAGSGHIKAAIVTYSQTDNLGDPANSIATSGDANICIPPSQTGGGSSDVCSFSVASRVGSVGLIAAVIDHSGSGAGTNTLIGWAYRVGITVVGGADQASLDLNVVAPADTTTEGFTYATPPAGLGTLGGIAGVDLGDDGVFQLPIELVPTNGSASLLVPKLSVFTGSTYRFTGVAQAATGVDSALPESVVLVRNQTGATISSGTWLDPPSNVSASLTRASWTSSAGATVESIEYVQGQAHLLNVTAFDGRTSVTIPSAIALPTTGAPLVATVSAIHADIDLTNFGLDADSDKIDGEAAQPAQVSN